MRPCSLYTYILTALAFCSGLATYVLDYLVNYPCTINVPLFIQLILVVEAISIEPGLEGSSWVLFAQGKHGKAKEPELWAREFRFK